MFITYKINDDLYLPAELYTLNTTKAVRDAIFAKYLYKITRYGVCVRIKSIEIVDNLILRREADLLVKVAVEIVVIKLNTNEYFQGEVTAFDQLRGIIVSFMGILEGRIPPENLHTGTLFNGKWILPFNENAAFEWKVGDKVRFKVDGADWTREGKRMSDLIALKSNEQGLGPISWWI